MSAWYDAARYRVRIISAALGQSKESGTPQIEIGLEVLGGYDAATRKFLAFTGPPRTVYLSLSQACLGTPSEPGWVSQTLTDLGFTWKSFSDLSALIGHEREAECKLEDYQGEIREKWSLYRLTRGPARPADPKATRILDARHKDLFRAFGKGQPAAPPPKPNGKAAPPPPAVGDDADPQQTLKEVMDDQRGTEIPF